MKDELGARGIRGLRSTREVLLLLNVTHFIFLSLPRPQLLRVSEFPACLARKETTLTCEMVSLSLSLTLLG